MVSMQLVGVRVVTSAHRPTRAVTVSAGGLDHHLDPVVAAGRTAGDPGPDERGHVVEGRRTGREGDTGARGGGDPIDPERPPVVPVEVVAHQVPAGASGTSWCGSTRRDEGDPLAAR